MGWDGRVREGRGGEYDGECLIDDDRKDDAEDGKGSRGGVDDGGNPTTTVTMLSVGRPSGAWGAGR
jgi:hypothetical protein